MVKDGKYCINRNNHPNNGDDHNDDNQWGGKSTSTVSITKRAFAREKLYIDGCTCCVLYNSDFQRIFYTFERTAHTRRSDRCCVLQRSKRGVCLLLLLLIETEQKCDGEKQKNKNKTLHFESEIIPSLIDCEHSTDVNYEP